MKISRLILIWSIAHVVAGWIIINLLAWPHCYGGYLGSLSLTENQAIERHSIIATYKTKSSGKRIWIERLQLRRPWKYLFYTPKFFTNVFYRTSDPCTAEAIAYVTSGSDTDRFCFVPKELVVHMRKDTSVIIYSLDKKYQENIDKIATVPFFEKIDSGPFLNDND
jgi:hypothetical protein